MMVEEQSLAKLSDNSTHTHQCIMLGLCDLDGYEKSNRVYHSIGVSRTLTARDYKDPVRILVIEDE